MSFGGGKRGPLEIPDESSNHHSPQSDVVFCGFLHNSLKLTNFLQPEMKRKKVVEKKNMQSIKSQRKKTKKNDTRKLERDFFWRVEKKCFEI